MAGLFGAKLFSRRFLRGGLGILAGLASLIAAAAAKAEPAVVMDVATGAVLYEEQPTDPWYPASLTKLMTLYVALSAVRDHKITLDTPLVVSARALTQAPSKMGFAPGTQVTLDNALKMLMVKSANDIAVTVAEGVSGSVEAFAEDMNAAAASLGLRQSHFVNPNGLHDPAHVSSALDMALIARAIYVNFPDYAGVFDIGSLRLGDQTIPTHNMMLGRYPGADGMKTGFTCAAGFNLVASAQRGGHRYVAVVLGAPTVAQRMVKAAILLDRAFDGVDQPHSLSVATAQAGRLSAPDMHDRVCKRRSLSIASFQNELETLQAPLANRGPSFVADNGLFVPAKTPSQKAALMARKAMGNAPVFSAVSAYVGPAPGYNGLIAQARPPHSPVGTEPPPEAASAYAAFKTQLDPGVAALKPDAAALPLKRHASHDKAAVRAQARKIMAHAKADEADQKATPAPAKSPKKAQAKPAPEHKQQAKKVAQKSTKVVKANGDADPAPHAVKTKKKKAKSPPDSAK